MFNANGNFDLLKNNYLFATIGEKNCRISGAESRCRHNKARDRRLHAPAAKGNNGCDA